MSKNEFISTNNSSSIVEIFKTNICNEYLANRVVADLNKLYPDYLINFDLEDCDKVLRIESKNKIDVLGVIEYGKENTFEIELIDY